MADENPLAGAARGKERVVVVHHWDADGITSAALVIEEVRRVSPGARVENRSPTIGRWALDEGEVASLRGWDPDLLVIVDLAIRDDDLDAILDGLPGVPALMVDHHRAEVPEHPRLTYRNPVAEGLPETDYPSCSWVLREMLDRDMDLLTVLGVFGDRGRGMVEEPIWETMRPFLEVSELDWDGMHRLVDLVDSSAKRVDLPSVNAAVGHLLEGWREPRDLLELSEWVEGSQEVESALERELERGPETVTDGILVKTIDTPYLVISTAARRLLRTRDQPVVIVTNLGYSDDEVQAYVRRKGELDLAPLIPVMRARGYSAGGKGEVLGVILPADELEWLVRRVMQFVSEHGMYGTEPTKGEEVNQ
jgi:single-stranded DNA-specific DHH superfamily exonuclease